MRTQISLFVVTLSSLLVMASCSSTPKTNSEIQVSYDEFQKILTPRNITILEGQNAFLTTTAMPGDVHPSIYRFDMATKKFTKEYDHGQTISSIDQDRTGRITYAHIDNKGDENFGIYIFDTQNKSVSPLFVKPGFRSYVIDADEQGQNLFIGSNFENKAVYSIYRMDLKTKQVQRISDGVTNLYGAVVSRSGSKVLGARSLSNNEIQIFLIDVKTRKTTALFKHKNSIFHPRFFTADEKAVVGMTDYAKDRQGCAQIDLVSPNKVQYLLSSDDKDISCNFHEWSKTFSVVEQQKGKSSLKLYKSMFADEIAVPQVFNNQSVEPIGFDRTNRKMLLQFSAANSPGTLYNFAIDSAKNDHVLDYNISSIRPEQLATSYDFEYKSFDGLPIHGVIFAKPEWLASGKKYPLIVWPHGGPDSSERHDYRGIFQFLALNGFVVFAPNYRGSTGYGKKFETLNDKDWGGGHVRDMLVGKDQLAKLSYIDANNVFLLGGSFGGYTTLATVAFHPTSFKAAVGVVALGNLFTFMKSIPPDEGWQQEFIREMGDPVKDQALYRERSPFFHVERISVPLQIYQAENDIRTVKAEMDTFVAELRRLNKPVDYTVLRDVGHGLETPESRKLVYEGAVKFFKSKMM